MCAKEIEKKYLIYENGINHVTDDFYEYFSTVFDIKREAFENGELQFQGYMPESSGQELLKKLNMSIDFQPSVYRLRKIKNLISSECEYVFTIKSAGMETRDETEIHLNEELYNYYWPFTDGKRVEKIRLKKELEGHIIEFDVYTDRDLIVAEIEVDDISEFENIVLIGVDVSADPKYKNSQLAK